MRPVIWSARARQDLDSQIAYISMDSQQAAIRVRDRIFEVTDLLGHFATGRRGATARTYEHVVAGYPYVIVYRIVRSGGAETVEIARLIHTSRNWRQ